MATVLLIEDDVLLADCYMRWLAADGHTAKHAPTAQDAFDMLDDFRPGSIILDILLPGANGVQLLQLLHSHADLADIPVIICSNAVTDQAPFYAYGAQKVLNKPTLTRHMLCRTVKEVLR